MHLAYIWIVSHLSAKNYQNRWKFDEVLTKTNLLSFLGYGVHLGLGLTESEKEVRKNSYGTAPLVKADLKQILSNNETKIRRQLNCC